MAAPIGNSNGVKWTTEQDETLKRLYADHLLSCTAIARWFPGKSRNSIIGRVHRLQLPLRGNGKGQRAPRNIQRKSTAGLRISLGKVPAALRVPTGKVRALVPRRSEIELRCAAIEPLHIPLGELTKDNCHWPYGDGPFSFCGHARFQGSYCAAHFYLSIGPGTPGERAANHVSRRQLEGMR